MDIFLIAFWSYLIIAVLSLVVPLIWVFKIKPKAWFSSNEADKFPFLEDEYRKRLNFHLAREKCLFDYWRTVIVALTGAQYYCTFYSVAASILVAAIAPLAKDHPHGSWLLSLVSIHLAVTVGLYKAFKVERTLADGLRLETEFYTLFYRFQDSPEEFGDPEKRVANYLKKFDCIRAGLYQTELAAIPSPHGAKGGH